MSASQTISFVARKSTVKALVDGFTKRYQVKLLVYYEVHQDIAEAILREKRIKRWLRSWKIRLIKANNPRWLD